MFHKLALKYLFTFCIIFVSANTILAETKQDAETGFIIDEGWEIVKINCTACHSSRLVIQNNLTKKGWLDTIKWMQEEQGLWPLGDFEAPILNYLAKNYGITNNKKGKRKLLSN